MLALTLKILIPVIDRFFKLSQVNYYFAVFSSRRLYVFLSMLVNGDEDDKSEDNINKENESILMIVSILETIKLSEDSVDKTKSKVCVQVPT